MKIEYTEKITSNIIDKMSKGLTEYEQQHSIDIRFKPFAFLLFDEHKTVFGVLNAYTAFSEVYIEDLWIDKSVRNQGYGKKLIQTLEESFKNKGYNNINLVTNAFQAPEFYTKCGYQIEFIRENKKNPKLTKTFFIKYF